MGRVVQISSLGHSGSTAVGLMLGGHPELAYLGELSPFLREVLAGRSLTDLCTCGEVVTECAFWGGLVEQFQKELPSIPEAYDATVEAATSGAVRWVVDSSKPPELLSQTALRPGQDTRVIELTRDVRGWAISRLEAHQKERKRPHGSARAAVDLVGLFRVWHRRSVELEARLGAATFPRLPVSYESLFLDRGQTAASVRDFLDLDSPLEVALHPTRTHCARGNRMRVGASELAYDARWLTDRRWYVAAATQRGTMRRNARVVYGNS